MMPRPVVSSDRSKAIAPNESTWRRTGVPIDHGTSPFSIFVSQGCLISWTLFREVCFKFFRLGFSSVFLYYKPPQSAQSPRSRDDPRCAGFVLSADRRLSCTQRSRGALLLEQSSLPFRIAGGPFLGLGRNRWLHWFRWASYHLQGPYIYIYIYIYWFLMGWCPGIRTTFRGTCAKKSRTGWRNPGEQETMIPSLLGSGAVRWKALHMTKGSVFSGITEWV